MLGTCNASRSKKDMIFYFDIESALETTERNFRKGYQQNCWGWMRSLTDQELDEMHQEIVSFYSKNVPDAKTPLAITQAVNAQL